MNSLTPQEIYTILLCVEMIEDLKIKVSDETEKNIRSIVKKLEHQSSKLTKKSLISQIKNHLTKGEQ